MIQRINRTKCELNIPLWVDIVQDFKRDISDVLNVDVFIHHKKTFCEHGTSTQLNDRIETRALKLALGDERARQVPMSALKSQIGHPQGACGAAGVAATLIAMRSGKIPPTLNLENPDPDCDLDYVPLAGRTVEIEHAICNCIAFGSKNSALVLRRVA